MTPWGAGLAAADWLGRKKPQFGSGELSPAKSATENRCAVTALVQVLAGYEASLHRGSWRDDGTHNHVGRYLRFLSEKCGYTLSEVEQYAISSDTA